MMAVSQIYAIGQIVIVKCQAQACSPALAKEPCERDL